MMTGKGTDVCSKCDGPKEATRRGSLNCRTCDTGQSKAGARRYRLTLSVSEAVWNRLNTYGSEAGLSNYAAANRVLSDWARAGKPEPLPVSDTSDTVWTEPAPVLEQKVQSTKSVDPQTLDRAVKWMMATSRVKPDTIKTKSALLGWCVEQGFKP